MPSQSGKSPLNLGGLLKKHSTDATELPQDFTRLPAGISGGVAQIAAAALGTYKTGPNTGQKFMRLAATVVSPETAVRTEKVFRNGKVEIVSSKEVPVKGLQTSVMFALCDTKNAKGEVTTADENVASALNELRVVAGDDFTADIESEADLEAKLDALVEAAPLTKFGTRASDPTAAYPEPRTFETWYGSKGLEDFVPSANGQVMDNSGAPVADRSNDNPDGAADEPEADDDIASSDDLVALLALSGQEDEEGEAARSRLKELAMEAGATEEDVDGADSWETVAGMIGNVPAEGEEPAAWEPKKGEPVKYQPLDPKTKKPALNKAKKPLLVECEITAVAADKASVTLKNLDDGKTIYKAVKVEALIHDDIPY